MTGGPGQPTVPPADRVPAETIRAIRRFHGRDQVDFAACFQVSTRTVIRWEQRGLDPLTLEPEWRRELLKWLMGRYRATASPDNRKTIGEGTA